MPEPVTTAAILATLKKLIISALISKGIAVTAEKLSEIINRQECARLFGLYGEAAKDAFQEKNPLKVLKIPVSLVMEPDILTKCLFPDEQEPPKEDELTFDLSIEITEEELRDREFEHLTKSGELVLNVSLSSFYADDTVNLMSYILGLLCSNKLPTTRIPFKVTTYNLVPLINKYNELESVYAEKFYKWLLDDLEENKEISPINLSYTIRTFPLSELNYLNVDVTGTNSLLASYYQVKNRIVNYQLQTGFYTSYIEEPIDLSKYSFAVSTSSFKVEKKDKEFPPQNCAYVIIDAQKKENNLKEKILQILITIDLLGNEFVKFTLMINGILYSFPIKDFVLNQETKMYQYIFSIREGEEIRGNVSQKNRDLVIKYNPKETYRLLGVLLTNAYLGDPDKEDTPKRKCASKYEFIVEPDKEEDKEERKIYLVHPIPYDVRPATTIPQLVMQFAEIHEEGKARNAPNITIIIPFPKLIEETDYAEPPIPSYRHGSCYAKVTNSFNVSIIVNGETLEEANRVLDICLALSNLLIIDRPRDKDVQEEIPRTEGYRKNRDIEPKTVIIRHIKYYSKGYKSDCWDWRKTYNTPGYQSTTRS